jgi:hypothetical protein
MGLHRGGTSSRIPAFCSSTATGAKHSVRTMKPTIHQRRPTSHESFHVSESVTIETTM